MCKTKGVVGESHGERPFLYVQCTSSLSAHRPTCVWLVAPGTPSFLCPEYRPSSSWLLPSTPSGVGHQIKLHLFQDACPDYPSEIDFVLLAPTPTSPVARFSTVVTMLIALFTLLLVGLQTVISGSVGTKIFLFTALSVVPDTTPGL